MSHHTPSKSSTTNLTKLRPHHHMKTRSDGKDMLEKSQIKVVVRMRSPNDRERASKSPSAVYIPEGSNKEIKFINEAYDKREPPTFKFDKVFGQQTTQQEIFESVASPLVEEVINGFNCTLFAYGQTGTGKTHTMEGNLAMSDNKLGPEAGIIPRVLGLLFKRLDSIEDSHSVRLSMLEIYNEEVGDLFSLERPTPKLQLNVDGNGKLQIQGQEEIIVDDVERGIQLLEAGSSRRNICATDANTRSSRSHCIFTLTVRIKVTLPDSPDVLKEGKLHLVDLAGSENGKTSQGNIQVRETGAINQSLLALGRVINALAAKEDTNNPVHIPYRESKLTRILQDSLGGRTKTCLIATISPCKISLDETNNTLKYASKAMKIFNTPITNQRVAPASEIRRLKEEVKQIRNLYEKAMEENNKRATFEEHNRVQAQLEEQVALVQELQEKLKSAQKETSQAMTERDEALATLNSQHDSFLQAQADLESSRTILRNVEEGFGIKEESLEETIRMYAAQVQEGDVAKASLADAQEQIQELLDENQLLLDSELKMQDTIDELNNKFNERTSEMESLQNQIAMYSDLEDKNKVILSNMKGTCLELHSTVTTQLETISSRQSAFLGDIDDQLKDILDKHTKNNQMTWKGIQEGETRVNDITQQLQQASEEQTETTTTVTDKIRSELNDLGTTCDEYLKQPPHLFDNIRNSTHHAIENFVAQLTSQQNDVLSLLKEYETSIASQLENHRVKIERFISDVQVDNQNEVQYWKAQTARLQSSLDEHQQELPLRLEELKRAISANIDSFAGFGQKIVTSSSEIVTDSRQHITTREASTNLPNNSETIKDSLVTITGHQGEFSQNLNTHLGTLTQSVSELPSVGDAITTETLSLVDHQFHTVSEGIRKNISSQQSTLSEFGTVHRKQTDHHRELVQELQGGLNILNGVGQDHRDRVANNVSNYSANLRTTLDNFTTTTPLVDDCVTSLQDATHLLTTTLPHHLHFIGKPSPSPVSDPDSTPWDPSHPTTLSESHPSPLTPTTPTTDTDTNASYDHPFPTKRDTFTPPSPTSP